MLSDELINPYKLDPKDEFPHIPEATPYWTEHYYFGGIDAKGDVSVFIHISREPTAPEIWRTVIGIPRPGDKVLVAKYCGRDGDTRGPGAGPLRIRCLEPFRRWTVEFDGLMERTDQAALTHRPHYNSIVELVKFDLTFEAAAPFW